MNIFAEIQSILSTMDIPSSRRHDYKWIARNLGVKNLTHKDFNRAMELIKEILKGAQK